MEGIVVFVGIAVAIGFLAWAIFSKKPTKQKPVSQIPEEQIPVRKMPVPAAMTMFKNNIVPLMLVLILAVQCVFLYFFYSELRGINQNLGTIQSRLSDLSQEVKSIDGDLFSIDEDLSHIGSNISNLNWDLQNIAKVIPYSGIR